MRTIQAFAGPPGQSDGGASYSLAAAAERQGLWYKRLDRMRCAARHFGRLARDQEGIDLKFFRRPETDRP